MVYSMSLDGPIRGESGRTSEGTENGFLSGSRALDSLDKLITSTESFFHPSNTGHWTLAVRADMFFLLNGNVIVGDFYSSPVSSIASPSSSASAGKRNSSHTARHRSYVPDVPSPVSCSH